MKWIQKAFWCFILFGVLQAPPAQPRRSAEPGYGGGPFGIGVELGYPGDWGIVGKLWLSPVDALQPDIKFTGGQSILQLDCLWHSFRTLHLRSGSLPFYIGMGGDLSLTDPAEFGLRVPLGLSYIFGRRTPRDIYAQIVPTFWITSGSRRSERFG